MYIIFFVFSKLKLSENYLLSNQEKEIRNEVPEKHIKLSKAPLFTTSDWHLF
jgi:hypothetical protein